ncbi:efflux transporter periplasmic adaptor subunit [Vibrio sp. 10N.286.49.B3]|uniref:efflux RND transporter periplasmic adaptor subunit n=1 Tax=Vibrio sp. 10N.286.49.B3 TaxID=1880855 RepID=UPI000C837EC0|nr:efflux RND transporter periplasmic adaptor subunit [Vibrio sp. 10N.286.49.B3]PMH37538.1 efflux transporter periplasmic adaptor subunit [Vibrio sp. 10N.286.49.B3]
MKKIHVLCALAVAVSGVVNAAGAPVHAINAELTSMNPSKTIIAKFESQAQTFITPRVTGYLVEQNAEDGAMVQKGDVLFKLDATVYLHNLQLAQAHVKQAQAAHKSAELHYDRVTMLQGPGGSTQSDLELAQAQLDSADAALYASGITLEKATYDLESTTVRAPYAGQLGKSRVSVGDQVSPASGALIDIVQLSPMNVAFNMDYDAYQSFEIDNAEQSSVTLTATGIETEVNYVANQVSPTAGTIQVSASFDNSAHGFKPNKVTYVTVESNQAIEGFWVPQSALMQDLTIQYVYVIDENNTAQRRDVAIMKQEKGQAFITEGIEAGSQIITDGLIRIRPNSPVSVQNEE